MTARKILISLTALALAASFPLGDTQFIKSSARAASQPTASAISAPQEPSDDPEPLLLYLGPQDKIPHRNDSETDAVPTGDALYNIWRDKKYATATGLPEQYDAGTNSLAPSSGVTHDECAANTEPQKFWFKNRFSLCYMQEIGTVRLDPETGVPIGVDFYDMNIIANVVAGQQDIRFSIRIRYKDSTGAPTNSGSIGFRIECSNADPIRTSTCLPTADDPQLADGYPISYWKTAGSKTFGFTVNTTTTAVPTSDLYAAELRGYFNYEFVVSATLPGFPASEQRTAREFWRCDSASYVYNTNGKCVFHHLIPSLQMSASDPNMGESASFILDAQTKSGGKVAPNNPHKQVPGRFNESVLERLYKGYDVKRTSPPWRANRIDASRRKIKAMCKSYFGATYTEDPSRPNAVMECDEYPFATTYQNSALVDETSPWDYAVRPVIKGHNGAAGNYYGQWMSNDRILDKDPFYVIITP